ncbi:Trypsin-like cysteine/serine peptidase domain [Plasmopara halstedii]|uniref:Trypsin-like cysteine/serine peptidase domain n=1 Tax=Plasmopara halstedii TaxID=4781 RepID=A0A0P1A624_PLAHL|nr:Trypsin-like cysteine/serine peptidase domain [Plasmopara halstedii]CEG35492.1 Trypsin-like cysteine/serine peptidase domain [Plasmopara halstedii]|eukprot:XP_024571861.1 Trypsin-like cysteine/serine peptidase domain [Plasmopara halstedii]
MWTHTITGDNFLFDKVMASRSRPAVLSITTRFCLPHEGMTTLDYLSSGSAVVLRNSMNSSLSIITSHHVACPWMFPKYFASMWDWLQFVNEDHVRHSLQLLIEDNANSGPKVLLDLPLAHQVQTHGSRDLALLSLKDSAAIEIWRQAEQELKLQPLMLQQMPCERGDPLIFSGHKQLFNDQKDIGGYQIPKTVRGHFVGRSTSRQEFAWSQELLEEGMCGGAVISSVSGQCVGIIEGIVPTIRKEDEDSLLHDEKALGSWKMRQALAGHVAFIPASDVREFIKNPDGLLLTGMELPLFM